MLRVIRNHRRAAYNAPASRVRGADDHAARHRPARTAPPAPAEAARQTWDRALALGEKHGYRNAQVTVLAPTGTIGLVMDCDTTGIEPDFALVKFKKLAGGGYFKIINQSLPVALRALGYGAGADRRHRALLRGRARSQGAPHINRETLARARASTPPASREDRARPRPAFDIAFAFNRWTLGEDYCATQLGLNEARLAEWTSTSSAPSASPRPDRGGQRLRLRHHDRRGRAAPASPSTTRSSTAPTAAAGRASASSPPRRTSA